MKFTVITLFPDLVLNLKNYSVIGRALNKVAKIKTVNLRDFGLGHYQQVDDKPYGGGVGMLLRADVAEKAIQAATKSKPKKSKVILMSADGKKFTQKLAEEYSQLDELIIFCGHYEGHDKRIESLVDEKVSVGDFVTSGGELPAMLIIDATTRLLRGALGCDESGAVESFAKIGDDRILEYPQYTRPYDFKGNKVPKVLLSGDPKKIALWQKSKTRKSKLS